MTLGISKRIEKVLAKALLGGATLFAVAGMTTTEGCPAAVNEFAKGFEEGYNNPDAVLGGLLGTSEDTSWIGESTCECEL